MQKAVDKAERLYQNTPRHIIVAGDFNNRARLEDRISTPDKALPGNREVTGTPSPPQFPQLTLEERHLQSFQESRSLEDLALLLPNKLEFFPLSSKNIQSKFPPARGQGKICILPSGKS